MEKQELRMGTAAMLAASFCFSLGGLLMKIIPWNPLAINGARNLIACCVIGAYILYKKTPPQIEFYGCGRRALHGRRYDPVRHRQ